MPTTGTVKWFSAQKGYGFISLDDGKGEVFVHHSAILADGFRTLKDGERVELEVVQGQRGPAADKVKRLAS